MTDADQGNSIDRVPIRPRGRVRRNRCEFSHEGMGELRKKSILTIDHPLIELVESPEPADPLAIQDALELLVRWAVRRHRNMHAPAGEIRLDVAAPPEP